MIGSAAKRVGPTKIEPLADDQRSTASGPDHDLMVREDLRRVLEAMDSLPPRQREVLHLSACEGLSVSEIAQVLGITSEAAKASLCEARKRLRRRFRGIDCAVSHDEKGRPMTAPRCDQLDEYLCGWLPPDEAARFEAHLADCAACREECALQRRIDRMLADGNASFAPVPAGLRSRIDRGIRAARRRRMACMGHCDHGSGRSCTGIGALGERKDSFRATRRHMRRPKVRPRMVKAPSSIVPPLGSEPPVPAVHVTMVDPASAIVMPVESHRPNVTLVCVFPTIRVDSGGRKREIALSAALLSNHRYPFFQE